MAITKNMELIKENLSKLGLDYDAAEEIIANKKDGFAVSYNHLGEDKAYLACIKLRTVLYSWLSILGIKRMYTIGIRNNAVMVGKKLMVDNITTVPIQVVATRNRSKKAKEKAYPVFAEAESDYSTGQPLTEEKLLDHLQSEAELGNKEAGWKYMEIMERRIAAAQAGAAEMDDPVIDQYPEQSHQTEQTEESTNDP